MLFSLQMDQVRAFIAVDIGDSLRSELDELQRKLKKVHANVRWVKPGNIHLTLVFLGNVPAEQIDVIGQEMERSCAEQSGFELQASGAGFFGKRSHPRVIWTGVADCPPLLSLQSRIVRGLNAQEIGFDNKPFSPHLTLGRVKGIDQHTEPLMEKLERYSAIELGSVHIDRVELIQSTLTPRGAEYSVLHRAVLQKGND
jgi:2'-5' RNA ligase